MILLFIPFTFSIGIFCSTLLQIQLSLASLEAHKAWVLQQSESSFNRALVASTDSTELLHYTGPTISIHTMAGLDAIMPNNPKIVVSVRRSE